MWILTSKISDILRFTNEEEAIAMMDFLLRQKVKVTIRYVKG